MLKFRTTTAYKRPFVLSSTKCYNLHEQSIGALLSFDNNYVLKLPFVCKGFGRRSVGLDYFCEKREGHRQEHLTFFI